MAIRGKVEGVLDDHARHFDEIKDFNWGIIVRGTRSKHLFCAHMLATVGAVPDTPYAMASTCRENKCRGSLEQAPPKLANRKPKKEVPCRPVQRLCPSAVPYGNQNAHGVYGTWQPANALVPSKALLLMMETTNQRTTHKRVEDLM